jgi:uncharacterized protein (TIGR02145 family)
LKNTVLCLILNILTISFVLSQSGISVNSTGIKADNSTILDISSTSQGLLIPRMTTVQRNFIASPTTSLLIFNITTNCFEAYVNGSWYSVSCPPPCTNPVMPTAGTNTPGQTQIVWNWNTVAGATGYKWNTVNIYSTSSDNGAGISFTQTGLTCNTSYSLYIWSYNSCGNSASSALTQKTSDCNPATPVCGYQLWMSHNLNNPVNEICYNNTPSNCTIYGGLYTWYGAMLNAASVDCDPCGPTTGHGGVQGICPVGFHIPSDLEFSRYEYCVENNIAPAGTTPLSTFQTGTSFRGSITPGVGPGDKMRVTSSNNPPWDGTNASGFSALPAGFYYSVMGIFSNIYGSGITLNSFWTATEYDGAHAWDHHVFNGNAQADRWYFDPKANGYSIRCLQD